MSTGSARASPAPPETSYASSTRSICSCAVVKSSPYWVDPGSGKSTLLRIIAGLIPATSGTVRYRGTELNGANPGAALVFQSFALMPWLTVQDNVELGLAARRVLPAQRRERALDAIDMIGLDGFESAYPKELSRRHAATRGLRARPRLEPTFC